MLDFVNITAGYESMIQHLEDEVCQHSSEKARLVHSVDSKKVRAATAVTEVASNAKVIDCLCLQLEAEAKKLRATILHTPVKERICRTRN